MTARFHYRAADGQGRVVEGDVQSTSRREALEDLRRRELYPVDITEIGAVSQGGRHERQSLGEALAVWTRTLATMLSAGVQLDRALAFESAEAGNKSLGGAVDSVRKDLRAGSSLAAALRNHPDVFSPLYVAMVSAGEETGALDQVLSRLADNLDEASEFRSRVRAALLYPALMAIVAAMGVTVILLFVVPRFVDMLGEIGGTLPLSTRILVGASNAIVSWWWIWLLIAAVGIWGVRRWMADPLNKEGLHAWRLGLPLVGPLETNAQTARFTRTLGLLMNSGIGILPALRIARSGLSNLSLASRLQRVSEGVSQGKRLGSELAGVFPPLAVQLISLGEETGRMEELCIRVADTYDRDVSAKLRNLIALAEPTLIVAFGLLVGFVALAMLQAIYSVNANIL